MSHSQLKPTSYGPYNLSSLFLHGSMRHLKLPPAVSPHKLDSGVFCPVTSRCVSQWSAGTMDAPSLMFMARASGSSLRPRFVVDLYHQQP